MTGMNCHFSGLDPHAALIAVFALAVPVLPAAAQQAPLQFAQAERADQRDALTQHELELKAAAEEQRKSAEAAAALRAEIEKIGADRRKLNQDLIDTAARLRGVEDKIEATQDASATARRHRSRHPQIARGPARRDRRSAGRACNASAAGRRRR